MNLSTLFRGGFIALIVLALNVAGWSAEKNTPPQSDGPRSTGDELIIANGNFKTGERSSPATATMRNLVASILRRYPEANITLVGAEDILVENATIRWRKRFLPNDNTPDSGAV